MHDIQIVIRAHNVIYAVFSLLVMYAIDRNLLALPIFALALAIIIVPVFAVSVNVERILDLSAFSIDWSVKDEKNRGVWVSTTPTQVKKMRRSQAMRDRVRRSGILFSQRVEKKLVDDVVYEIGRSDMPILCALHEYCHHKDLSCAKDINVGQYFQRVIIDEKFLPSMPPPQPGSNASMPNYDRIWYLHLVILEGNQLIQNPFNWAQTAKKHVHVALWRTGCWLIKTPEADYVCQWHPIQQVWWYGDYGFGFYEQSLDDERFDPAKPYRFIFGDIYAKTPDANLKGSHRTNAPCGPYWYAAFYDFQKVEQMEREETKKAALKAAQEKAAMKAAMKAAQEKLRKQKAEETQKVKARTARRGISRPTAAPQQKYPFTTHREFSFAPKQRFSAPKQAFSYTFTAPTEMDTGFFAETESEFTSSSLQRDFTSTSPRQSKFAFGSSPSQSSFTFNSSPSQNFEIPVTWEYKTDVPRPVPVMPIQGKHQR